MRRPGGIGRVKASRQCWGHRVDHWRGLPASSAGGTVTIDFTADIPGQFEVEAHKLSSPLLFTLVVN